MTPNEKMKKRIASVYELRCKIEPPKNWKERFEIYQYMLAFASGYKLACCDLTNLQPDDLHKIVSDIYLSIEKTICE